MNVFCKSLAIVMLNKGYIYYDFRYENYLKKILYRIYITKFTFYTVSESYNIYLETFTSSDK